MKHKVVRISILVIRKREMKTSRGLKFQFLNDHISNSKNDFGLSGIELIKCAVKIGMPLKRFRLDKFFCSNKNSVLGSKVK